MKKKIAKVLVAGLIGLQLIGCSNQNTANTEENKETTETAENTEAASVSIYFNEINADEYVTLGDYKGLEVVSNVVTITDADVDAYIEYMLSMSGGALEEVTDRDVVENGDVANIDYIGKKDGVAFDGGNL